jgi:hypothetical protein
MTLANKIQFGLATAAALFVCWELREHHRRAKELETLETRIQTVSRNLESGCLALAAAEQRNNELEEAERRAGNQTLLSLMRERAAAAAELNSAAPLSDIHAVGSALAKVLDNSDQQAIDREAKRNEMRSGMGLFFRLVKLSPEKIDQYIDVGIEKESRNASRISALLQGKLSLADALRERDHDTQELEGRQRALLGPEGAAFLDSIADGMRNDEAKRLASGIQQTMGDNALTSDQLGRLQGLIKTQFVTLPFDDVDLFRSPEEWSQLIGERQQNVLRAAADFVTPAQLSTLNALAAADLANRQAQIALKRKSLGIH